MTVQERLDEGSMHLRTVQRVLDAKEPLQARDWKGFFSALAGFAASMLPLIAPFFLKSESK
jgi:VIT1/CCC1 family predicted Fe2+/Mn2+ transporter